MKSFNTIKYISEMVETVKHAIVLLQIAKNASCPEKKADSTEDIAGVHVTQKKVVFFCLSITILKYVFT